MTLVKLHEGEVIKVGSVVNFVHSTMEKTQPCNGEESPFEPQGKWLKRLFCGLKIEQPQVVGKSEKHVSMSTASMRRYRRITLWEMPEAETIMPGSHMFSLLQTDAWDGVQPDGSRYETSVETDL